MDIDNVGIWFVRIVIIFMIAAIIFLLVKAFTIDDMESCMRVTHNYDYCKEKLNYENK